MKSGVFTCSVNPEFQTHYEGTLDKTTSPRNVAVIGAGPGGLQAAWVAATKGHKVTLYEKRDVLGGNLVEDAVPAFRVDKARLLSFFRHEMKRLGVNVKHEEATADTIQKGKYDAVIVATGSRRTKPKVKGIDKPIAIDFVEALQGKMKGNNVVILATDYEIRCVDVAFYASELKKKATLLFTQENVDWQIWIDAGEKAVPRKIVITYKNEADQPQYEAVLDDWRLATADDLARLKPALPPSAKRVDITELFGSGE